ncbi:MAG: M28 family peptidase [Planctomycetota bacterium]
MAWRKVHFLGKERHLSLTQTQAVEYPMGVALLIPDPLQPPALDGAPMHLPKKALPVFLFVTTLLLGGAAAAGSIIVVEGPLPPGAPDLLMKQIAYYGESGGIAVGEGDAADIKALRKLGIGAVLLGPWPEGQTLYVSTLDYVPADATILFRSDLSILFAVPGTTNLNTGGHHTVQVRRVPWQPSAGFRPPAGLTAKAVTVDPQIAALVAQVSQANLLATVTQLSSYHTRRSDQPTATQAKDWLVTQFQAIPGLTVTTDTYNGSYTPNIIATMAGTTHPEKILVLGAHYDSLVSAGATSPAPGADDNASGSAGILEAARLLTQMQFENTVRLVLFSAEEFGLYGSEADATDLDNANADVVAMLNMDMNAYRASGDALSLALITNDTDATLNQYISDVTNAYVPALPVTMGGLSGGTSDHRSFQQHGFSSAFLFEDLGSYSPYIHSSSDTVGLSANDFGLSQKIVQSFLATAAELAAPLRMEMSHTPLADTIVTGTAYGLAATVTSLTAATVTSVEAVYRINGGSFTNKALIPSSTANEWIGSLPGISPSGNMEYYLLATNSDGQQKWLPEGFSAGDAVHRFSVGDLTSIFADDFEAVGENGWTTVQVATQNDWQKGTPQGKGGYDPSFAASGVSARGNDLGIGNYNGLYQPNVDNYLQSPSINCSGQTSVRMRFNRWLSVEDGTYDHALVKVNGTTVWQNTAAGDTIDSAWTPQELDVSALADNNPAVSVRFQLQSDGGVELGGWTLDDFELFSLHDGVTPSLTTTETAISASQGSTVQFGIDAGPAHAGETYLLAVGISGAGPTMVNGVSVPLTLDPLTTLVFQASNTPSFQNFYSTLSGSGQASCTMVLPPTALPAIPGVTLYFAALTLQPVTWASNSVEIEFGN